MFKNPKKKKYLNARRDLRILKKKKKNDVK